VVVWELSLFIIAAISRREYIFVALPVSNPVFCKDNIAKGIQK